MKKLIAIMIFITISFTAYAEDCTFLLFNDRSGSLIEIIRIDMIMSIQTKNNWIYIYGVTVRKYNYPSKRIAQKNFKPLVTKFDKCVRKNESGN